MRPRVSVIMSTYQRPHLLGDALTSRRAQTMGVGRRRHPFATTSPDESTRATVEQVRRRPLPLHATATEPRHATECPPAGSTSRRHNLAQTVLLLGELRRSDLSRPLREHAAEVARLASFLPQRDTTEHPVSYSLEIVRCVDRAGAQRVTNETGRSDLDVTHVGIDPAPFSRRAQGELTHAAFTIGFVGTLVPVKQVPLLLEAFASMSHEPRRLRIAGDGQSLDEARRAAEISGLSCPCGWRRRED